MKLNQECVRQIMLTIESDIPYNHYLTKYDLINNEHLSSFSEDEILYSILRLDEAGFINCDIQPADNIPIYNLILSSLTWSGHQFLDNVRDPEVWRKTKAVTSKLASVSLTLISNIASEVIVRMIEKALLANWAFYFLF